jgi:hypothetical protein
MRNPSLTPAMISELNSLQSVDGYIDTNDVVAKAKDIKSALHKHPAFEWDVTKAAERQWHDAARGLIQIWVIIADRGDGEKTEIRATVSMADQEGERHYYSTPKILREDRARVINLVLDRVESAIRNYPLTEFDPILKLVAEIRAAASRPRRRPRKGGREARPSV